MSAAMDLMRSSAPTSLVGFSLQFDLMRFSFFAETDWILLFF
jgi:hypothetical protein